MDVAGGDRPDPTVGQFEQQGAAVVQVAETAAKGLTGQTHLDRFAEPMGMAQPSLADRRKAILEPTVDPGQDVAGKGLQQIDLGQRRRRALET